MVDESGVNAAGLVGDWHHCLGLTAAGEGRGYGRSLRVGHIGQLIGATGSSNFLSRTTAVLATVFFIATLALSYLATQARQPAGGGSVMQNTSEVPAAPPASPAPAGTPAASQVPGAPADSGAKK